MIRISFKQLLFTMALTAGVMLMVPGLVDACANVDLRIVKSGPESVNPGEVLIYTLTVTQHQAGIPGLALITDVIPYGLTFNKEKSRSCGISGTSQNIIACNVSGNPGIAIVAFNVPFNLSPSECLITNTARVRPSPLDREINFADNSSSTTTRINCATATPAPPGSTPTPTSPPTSTPIPKEEAKLSIDKVDNRDTNATQRGDTVTYKITVKNTGDADIQDVEVDDAIPAGFEVDRGSVTSGATFVGQNIRWANVQLAAGKSKSFTVKVKVTEAAALKGLCNVVTAKSGATGLSDQDQECIQVNKPPAVKQAKVTAPRAVPVSAKTGGVLTTAIFVALVAAVSAVIWQLKRRGVRIPINWFGGVIIVGVIAIVLFGLGGDWIKSQVSFKPAGPTCSCTCQDPDENLVCAQPLNAEAAQCQSFAFVVPAPNENSSLCAIFSGESCSSTRPGAVAHCNGNGSP